MELEIRLYSQFKKYAPGDDNIFTLIFPADTTVVDVFEALGIPVGMSAAILLNGRRAEMHTRIEPASWLAIFEPVTGG